MIIWGGEDDVSWDATNGYGDTKTGGVFDPSVGPNGQWTAMGTVGAPAARRNMENAAVWVGGRMIVWGGWQNNFAPTFVNSGGIYNPVTNSWAATTLTGAPSGRVYFQAVSTGSKMLIWGGSGHASVENTGALFDPSVGLNGQWTPIAAAPGGRSQYSSVWADTKFFVFGGGDVSYAKTNSFFSWNSATNQWTTHNAPNTPSARNNGQMFWTGLYLQGGRVRSFS